MFIKERFLDGETKADLRKFARDSGSLLDPRNPDFDGLLKKVKEIVERNRSRRLLKLPKVKLNYRKLLDGMLAICGVPQVKFRTICSSIDKLDKQTSEQIKKEMVGSVAAGGRFENLIGMFVTKQVFAVGISLVERVFTIMEQLQKDKNLQEIRAMETQVPVSIRGDDLS